MDTASQTACVILAGGRGHRMASKDRHKVCFPIADRPAIVRAIDAYKAAGLRRFLVVVGQLAEQVIATVSEAHPEATFVYQPEPRGTGHAAQVAVSALAAEGFRGDVLLVMGDKIIRPNVVRALLEQFAGTLADMIVTTLPKTAGSSAGRVVLDDDGHAVGIVEVSDIEQARRSRRRVHLGDLRLTAAQIEKRSPGVNASLYAFRFPALHEAVRNLRGDHASGELFLTDTVEYLRARGRVEPLDIEDPRDLMAFNTPAELLNVEKVVRQREKPPRVSASGRRRLPRKALRPARQWVAALRKTTPELHRKLARLYGRDDALIEDRRTAMRQLAEAFAERYGADREMVLCRAPGRVNLMGRHVDHRGGFVNVMAISRETLLAAAPRDDDLVTLRNLDRRRFPAREFSISELVSDFSWAEWMEFLGSRAAQSVLQAAPGDWSHYARAPLLRLQHEVRGVQVRGMDCLVSGNIPMGAGLSSSSALVVAFAEAAVSLNGLDVAMRDFVDLCGEGEWFVGSRGGAADHAAIRTSRAGYIGRNSFFPFRLAGQVRFPSRLRVVIAHSGASAVKSAGARDTFNQRVACYEIAQMLLRREWPAAAAVEHLRDLAPDKLRVSPADLYRALKRLPNRPGRKQVERLFDGADAQRLGEVLATHANVGPYDLRGVALYGISECVRSERFAEVIEAGDVGRIGQLMAASHNGDRVVRIGRDGQAHKHAPSTSDAALEKLAAEGADLALQSGRYACSTEAIDRLVDLAAGAEGVAGAQLAGAGLGGCMMILVDRDHLEGLMVRLRNEFYRPRRLAFGALVCTPVAGAGLLNV